jgi:hypothetical protein
MRSPRGLKPLGFEGGLPGRRGLRQGGERWEVASRASRLGDHLTFQFFAEMLNKVAGLLAPSGWPLFAVSFGWGRPDDEKRLAACGVHARVRSLRHDLNGETRPFCWSTSGQGRANAGLTWSVRTEISIETPA